MILKPSKTEDHWPTPWTNRPELLSGHQKAKMKSNPLLKHALHRMKEAKANMLISVNHPTLTSNKLEKGRKGMLLTFLL